MQALPAAGKRQQGTCRGVQRPSGGAGRAAVGYVPLPRPDRARWVPTPGLPGRARNAIIAGCNSSIAQLVERRTVNPQVPGSSPGRGAKQIKGLSFTRQPLFAFSASMYPLCIRFVAATSGAPRAPPRDDARSGWSSAIHAGAPTGRARVRRCAPIELGGFPGAGATRPTGGFARRAPARCTTPWRAASPDRVATRSGRRFPTGFFGSDNSLCQRGVLQGRVSVWVRESCATPWEGLLAGCTLFAAVRFDCGKVRERDPPSVDALECGPWHRNRRAAEPERRTAPVSRTRSNDCRPNSRPSRRRRDAGECPERPKQHSTLRGQASATGSAAYRGRRQDVGLAALRAPQVQRQTVPQAHRVSRSNAIGRQAAAARARAAGLDPNDSRR